MWVVPSHGTFSRRECIAGQSQALGLASCVLVKQGGRGWAREICTKRKTCLHITWYDIGWITLTHAFVWFHMKSSLPSHLRRNPLDNIVKSYCKTTHIKAAITSHLFLKRGTHCWWEPPHVIHPVRHSTWTVHQHVVYNNQLTGGAQHALSTDHQLCWNQWEADSSKDSCQAHTQSSNNLQVWVHHLHSCLTCKHWVSNSIIVSVNNKLSSFQKIPPHSEGAKDCKELKFENCSLSWCHIDHLKEFITNLLTEEVL